MSYKVNYTPTAQPCHKISDVAYSSGMKGQTVLGQAEAAVLGKSDPPDDSVPAPKALLWPDCAEEMSGMEWLLRKCRIRNQLLRECLAECLGVYILIVSVLFYGYELVRCMRQLYMHLTANSVVLYIKCL